jgi:hypothetical protein
VIAVTVRSRLLVCGLAGLLALGAVACEVDDMEPIDDPLEENDDLGS